MVLLKLMRLVILWRFSAGCLTVSRSAYYSWKEQKFACADEKKKEVEQTIISIFHENRRRYGVRSVLAELKGRGIKVNAYKVRKVLKKHDLKAIQPRSFVPKTTDSRHPYQINANLLLERSFPGSQLKYYIKTTLYLKYC